MVDLHTFLTQMPQSPEFPGSWAMGYREPSQAPRNLFLRAPTTAIVTLSTRVRGTISGDMKGGLTASSLALGEAQSASVREQAGNRLGSAVFGHLAVKLAWATSK